MAAIPSWAQNDRAGNSRVGDSEGVRRRTPTVRQGTRTGIIIDASEARAYAAEVAARTALLLPEVNALIPKLGAQVRKVASQRAIYTPHTRWAGMSWRSSFTTRTRRYATGASVTIESRAPLGTILTYGVPMKRTRPHDALGAAISEVQPQIHADFQALLARIL